jgi:hypothetical protein
VSATAADALLERFHAYCEQYLGIARALGEAATRAVGSGDPGQQARSFLDALGTLQQQAAGAASAAGNPFGAFNPFAAGGPFAAAAPFLAGTSLGAALSGGGANPWAAFLPGGAGFTAAAAPALGPTREFQQTCQRIAQVGEQLQQAQLRLLEQWNAVVSKALQQLGERASALLSATPTPETLRALYDQWIETAEAAYAQAAHGPAFAAAQADFGNAQSRLRSAQREYLELAAREFDLPTRAELNTVLQQLRDLKRSVRELEERVAGRGPDAP